MPAHAGVGIKRMCVALKITQKRKYAWLKGRVSDGSASQIIPSASTVCN